MTKTLEGPPPHPQAAPYALYERIFDVPLQFRKHKGGALELDQVNLISRRACELGSWNWVEDRLAEDGEGNPILEPDPERAGLQRQVVVLGGWTHADDRKAALEEFEKTHEIQSGVWVTKSGEVN